MTRSDNDRQTQQHAGESNTQKPPEQWTTGEEPMTGAQRSYLKTLSEEAREPFDDTLTKAEASRRIDELQKLTGRGQASERAAGRGGAPEAADDRTVGSRVRVNVRVNAPDAATTDAELEYREGGQNEADAHGGNVIGVSDR
jgi:hypothetical protein